MIVEHAETEKMQHTKSTNTRMVNLSLYIYIDKYIYMNVQFA